jgi:hypothetical protein
MIWTRNRTESNRRKTEDLRFETGVAKTEPKPDRTEPFRGVIKTTLKRRSRDNVLESASKSRSISEIKYIDTLKQF